MGNYTSQTVSEQEWKIEISMKKGTTNVSYVICSDTVFMLKTVRGQNGNPITFSVDPKTFEMCHGFDSSGTDGEANDLKAAIERMASILKDRFREQSPSENTEQVETEEEVIQETIQTTNV